MLNVNGLYCGYGDVDILRDINVNVRQGELVGIIGPNGSGKTTLLRVLTRILCPRTGTVALEGKNLSTMRRDELARTIAVVMQSDETPMISVEDFVLLGRIPHYTQFQFLEKKSDIELAHKWMKLTGAFSFKDRLLGEISGGERQLASIARALTQEPRLLLLDEPTAHLDIAHQVRVLDLVRRLNKEFGVTVIMVLHDLNLASEYCGRLLLIHQGRIYKNDAPENVITREVIAEVYKTDVVVSSNPVSGKPFMLLTGNP